MRLGGTRLGGTRLGVPRPSGRWRVLLLPLAWLAVVVVAAGLTWQVIDSAGRSVLTSGESPLSATGTTSGATPGAGTSSSSAGPTPRKRGDERPSESPRPSASAGATGQAGSSPGPSQQPSQQPSRQPSEQPSGQTSRQPVPSSSAPSPPPPQVQSWQGSAGTVTASCTGSAISLQSATPYDGWAVEVDDRGPGRVRVEFTSGGEDERETEVEAECSGGAPRYQVESND